MTKLHQPPAGEPVSADFQILINGEPVGAYVARVSAMPFNRVWPGHQRPLDQTELASFVSFSMDEPTRVRLVPRKTFEEAAIRPLSKDIAPTISGGVIEFTIETPGQYTVELDGTHHALHLFANPVTDFGVDPGADNVLYFGAGAHDAGPIELTSGQVLFIDEGAVVRTAVTARDAANIRIVGAGILDNSWEERDEQGQTHSGCLRLFNCANVEVNGIVFRDSVVWTATVFNCDNVIFDNVKTIGMWRYNADGIDFVNSANGIVKNSFLRNFDDLIVLKGLKGHDTRNVENIRVANCVLWCDWGRCLEIGAETCADEYRNILFEDCDLIHGAMAFMDFQNGDRARVHDVVFDNIRVEYSRHTETPVFQHADSQVYVPSAPHLPHLFFACVFHSMWSRDNLYGENHDIRFRNIHVRLDDGLSMPPSEFTGANAAHRTHHITIDGLYVNGRRITDIAGLNLTTNEFAHDIRLT